MYWEAEHEKEVAEATEPKQSSPRGLPDYKTQTVSLKTFEIHSIKFQA